MYVIDNNYNCNSNCNSNSNSNSNNRMSSLLSKLLIGKSNEEKQVYSVILSNEDVIIKEGDQRLHSIAALTYNKPGNINTNTNISILILILILILIYQY